MADSDSSISSLSPTASEAAQCASDSSVSSLSPNGSEAAQGASEGSVSRVFLGAPEAVEGVLDADIPATSLETSPVDSLNSLRLLPGSRESSLEASQPSRIYPLWPSASEAAQGVFERSVSPFSFGGLEAAVTPASSATGRTSAPVLPGSPSSSLGHETPLEATPEATTSTVDSLNAQGPGQSRWGLRHRFRPLLASECCLGPVQARWGLGPVQTRWGLGHRLRPSYSLNSLRVSPVSRPGSPELSQSSSLESEAPSEARRGITGSPPGQVAHTGDNGLSHQPAGLGISLDENEPGAGEGGQPPASSGAPPAGNSEHQ